VPGLMARASEREKSEAEARTPRRARSLKLKLPTSTSALRALPVSRPGAIAATSVRGVWIDPKFSHKRHKTHGITEQMKVKSLKLKNEQCPAPAPFNLNSPLKPARPARCL